MPLPSKSIVIELAGAKRRLSWSKAAQYRLGTLPRPPSLHDLLDERKASAAFIGILWASIENAEDLPGPEAVAQALPSEDEEKMAAIRKAFWAVINPGDDPKKAAGSTRGPSRASS